MTLPVIVVKGKKRKLVGVVSAWDVLESIILGRLIDNSSGQGSATEKK